MGTEESREARAAWDEIATGFDEHATPITTSFAEAVLERVGLRPGMRFLDVAAGSGALSIPAARLGAEVVATDFSSAMIDRLEARTRNEWLATLEARVMDGLALEFDDDTFDVVGSQNGVSLFPDVSRGLREMVRVTKPDGRVLVVAFGPPPKVEFISIFMESMHAGVPDFEGIPIDPPPLPFQLANPEVMGERLTDAGAKDVRVETVTWDMEFQSATHFWDVVTNSNPIAADVVADLSQEQIEAVQAAIDTKLRERSGGSSRAVLTNTMNVAIGTK